MHCRTPTPRRPVTSFDAIPVSYYSNRGYLIPPLNAGQLLTAVPPALLTNQTGQVT